nr:MetaGeneMark_Unknown Function [uncultured bacterium]
MAYSKTTTTHTESKSSGPEVPATEKVVKKEGNTTTKVEKTVTRTKG